MTDQTPHDETGTDLARSIANTVRGTPLPARRRRTARPVDEQRRWNRDPQLIGDMLDRFITQRGWRARVDIALLLNRWPQLVGELNAQHSKPETFDDGILTIRCDSGTWATSLRTMTPQIVALLNEKLGDSLVREIRVIGPHRPSRSTGPRRVNYRPRQSE